jgi:hypothetical protein
MDKLDFRFFYDFEYHNPHAEIIINGRSLSNLLRKLEPTPCWGSYAGLSPERLLKDELTSGKSYIAILSDRDWDEYDWPVVTCNLIKTENTVIWNNIRNIRAYIPPIPENLILRSFLIYDRNSEEYKEMQEELHNAYANSKRLVFDNLQFEFDKGQYKEAIKKLIFLCVKEYGYYELLGWTQGETYRMEHSEDFLDMKRKKHRWKHGDCLINQWNERTIENDIDNVPVKKDIDYMYNWFINRIEYENICNI